MYIYDGTTGCSTLGKLFFQIHLWTFTPSPPSISAGSSPHYAPSIFFLLYSPHPSTLSSTPPPPFFSPSPHNKSQSVYNPSGALQNSSGSNCRSIYTRQYRGLASLIWDFTEYISLGLTAWAPHSLGLIDVKLSRVFFKPRKEMTKKKSYSAQGSTVNSAAGQDEKQQVAHLLMVENSCGWLTDCSLRVGWMNISLCYLLTLSAALNQSVTTKQALTFGDDKSLFLLTSLEQRPIVI